MGTSNQRWFHHRGELARDGWESIVDGAVPGWEHTGLRIAQLDGSESYTIDRTGLERIVVPLSGSFTVTYSEGTQTTTVTLRGRASVFDGPTDVLYLSSTATAVISGTGRLAVAESPTDVVLPCRHILAEETLVELRGAGASSRQVHNFGMPQALDAARLIVCEVVTPAQNWSSYPPHKHDEHLPGHESRLEEIYYFESAPVSGAVATGADAFGMFSTYSSPAGEIDISARVHSGDIALVPFGYHGPAVAAPGYDLYYLNVMAGPNPERVWLISDDPAHAWVRETWTGQTVDPRLPFGDKEKGTQR
jgi:5-deoxy-glucuronate isomerase